MKDVKRRFEWIPVEELHSGLVYQRPINEDFIRDKILHFDKNEVETPCISFKINKDGKNEYRVIDGQHTIMIVKQIGWIKIRCEVREGLSEDQENEWFYKKNTKKRNQTRNRLQNSKIEGKFDLTTNLLVNSLESVGYKLKTSDIKNGKGIINAGLTIENIFKEMGELDFKKCMEIHSIVWDGNKKSISKPFLNGMCKFYTTYKDEFDSKRFINSFLKKNITAENIAKDVSNNTLKRDISIKYAWVLVEYYNKGLKDEKKLKCSKLID